MKSNPVRLLLATIACIVLQTVGIRAAEEEVTKPEPVTYLVTLKRTLLRGEVVSETSCHVSSEAGTFECTIPADTKAESKQPLIVEIEADDKIIEFSVTDLSMLRKGVSQGSSYAYPVTILATKLRRNQSDAYTLFTTDTEKLTISFKKVDPKELDEVPVAKEGEGTKVGEGKK
ncbi:MAG: hypothetical protein CFE26_14005 [Verrucomicrobiales bacterium VVV1]|nr:MAG: hypothetical protein CFE26_14005 [Verrucomicrobiales bacterium VVV1]